VGCFAIVAVRERSSASDIGGNSSVFVLLPTFCGSTRLNESVLNPLSRIMANDWFNFRYPAGSITGTSCIFFVQVAFVGIGSKLAWPGLCQLGHGDSRAQPHHAIAPV
jgi:hypothetical protein